MKYRFIAIFAGAAFALQLASASDERSGPPATAQMVTGGLHLYDEVLPVRSPDGRWLAFEYSEMSDPNFPRIGIMDLTAASHPWRPLLRPKHGRHLFVGDLSWSPDSQWLAVLTDYPEGIESLLSDTQNQVVKVDIHSGEAIKLTSFPPNTIVGPTTAWLRSGLIVFPAMDDGIYAVSANGGTMRKLISVPKNKCGGGTNTLAVTPDELSIAFTMDSSSDGQIEECNALWIGDLRTGTLRRLPTPDLHPLSPFWLDGNTILFSGEYAKDDRPLGLYSVSLESGKVATLLEGTYQSPFVCDSGKTLYFSWGPKLAHKTPPGEDWSTSNPFYGFHIWKVPLHDVLGRVAGPSRGE